MVTRARFERASGRMERLPPLHAPLAVGYSPTAPPQLRRLASKLAQVRVAETNSRNAVPIN